MPGQRQVRRGVDERVAPPARRLPGERPYLVLMGICVFLILMAWTWVYRLSTTAAVIMSAVALAIPPFAAIAANAGRETPQLREHQRGR